MATASDLMAEVTREYELCMSALVFDSNMMNEANIQVNGSTRDDRTSRGCVKCTLYCGRPPERSPAGSSHSLYTRAVHHYFHQNIISIRLVSVDYIWHSHKSICRFFSFAPVPTCL